MRDWSQSEIGSSLFFWRCEMQIILSKDELKTLQDIARRRGISVGEAVKVAIREAKSRPEQERPGRKEDAA